MKRIAILLTTLFIASACAESPASIAVNDVEPTEPVIVIEGATQELQELTEEPVVQKNLVLQPVDMAQESVTSVPAIDARPTIEVYISPPTRDPSEIVYQGGAYTKIRLSNARTGAEFTLADFSGKTVFVHPMATWCTQCRASHIKIRDGVYPVIQGEDVVFVSLAIDQVDNATLAKYADDGGYNWIFAPASRDMIAALVQDFGPVVTVAPDQPHFVIRPDGTATQLFIGSPPPNQTVDLIRREGVLE